MNIMMMKDRIVSEIRQTLRDSVDENTLASGDRYFKEEVKLYGVRIPVVNEIGRIAFEKLRGLSKQEIFGLCDELWQSGYSEEGYIACDWSYYVHEQYEPADFKVFEHWLKNYVTNWAKCDVLCNHTVGTFVEMYPEYVGELRKWAHSNNRWMRRAAAVTLIIPARKGLFLDDAFEIADTLLLDGDDLVQKGYGWMLKAASMTESFIKGTPETRKKLSETSFDETRKEHMEAVFDFVMARRTTMPRTALRYAIEKMPPELKAEAMKK